MLNFAILWFAPRQYIREDSGSKQYTYKGNEISFIAEYFSAIDY
jgi:hypothetical protein